MKVRVRTRSSRKSLYWLGMRYGRAWRRKQRAGTSNHAVCRAAQESWRRIAHKRVGRHPGWAGLLQQGKRYFAGFQKGSGKPIRVVPVPLRGTAAAVLYAPRKIQTLRRVLRQFRKLPLQQIVIVMNDATPAYFAEARAEPGVLIAHFPDLPDPDVGRALGAKLTDSDSVLFVDAERPVKAEKLARFLWATDARLDAALNDVSPQLGLFHERRDIFRLAEFLNTSLNRPDLMANSLAVLPFALSRRALDTLGSPQLTIPVKAHAAAILGGLRVGIGGSVQIRGPAQPLDESVRWSRMAGDHAEAWQDALSAKGNRLLFPDHLRRRRVMEEWAI